ncbi:MAG: hypothetical protein Rubg2KO_13130 [Rubricoccaceae bacterium]
MFTSFSARSCGAVLLCVVLAALGASASAQSGDRTLYWIGPETDDYSAIYGYSLDSGRIDTLIQSSKLSPPSPFPFRGFAGLSADVVEDRLYWTDSGFIDSTGAHVVGAIMSSDSNGGDIRPVVEGTVCGLGRSRDIEFSSIVSTLFWSNESDCHIGNLFYTNVGGVPIESRWLSTSLPFSVVALEVNVEENLIFWVSNGVFALTPLGVHAAPLDRTPDHQRIIVGPVCDIALDTKAASLYWSRCSDGIIYRSDLDGSNTEQAVAAGRRIAYLALDRDEQKIYWSEPGTDPGTGAIRRANVDGTGLETIVGGLTDPQAIELGFGQYSTRAGPEALPSSPLVLHPVSPNPARSVASVTFELSEPTTVEIALLDATGREVRQVNTGAASAGIHTEQLPLDQLPDGVYLVRIVAGGDIATRPVVIVR